MEVPFYRKYSLEPEQHKILKTAVLASIEHMKTLGGFYWYDDKGPRNPNSLEWAEDESGFRKFNEMKLTYNNMTYSDYHNNGKEGMKDYCPPYRNIVKTHVQPFLQHYADMWGCRNWEIRHLWFAQYEGEADFGWHTHEGCNMSAIYFVEAPEEHHITEFHGLDVSTDNPRFGEPITEGDLMVFPAMVPHRSKPIYNTKRKTIIGINGEMMNSNLE